ncbi:MAG: hypothetical protein HDS11_07060 [Bacteroides sp.]|nr:hypothetical protein [Bacteroides sp.]
MKRFVIGVIAGGAAMAAALTVWGPRCGGFGEVVADTVWLTDTLLVERPAELSRVRVASVVRELPAVADSGDAVSADTLRVSVPIERTVYEGEGYRAVVSGYEARLDSLELRRELMRVSLTQPQQRVRSSRWSVGVTAGVAVTPAGMQPMVGVGISYRLWAF